MNATTRDKIFISYSHRDKEWLDRLQTALKPLVRKQEIDVWADTRVRAGGKWREEIAQALKRARVAVLLVSQNFLASDFIANEEVTPILDAARSQGLTVLWIPVTASLYDETDIAEYQAAHDPARPLDSLEASQLNEALVTIAKVIRDAANPSGFQQETVTGQIQPAFRVVGAGAQPPSHQQFLRDLERAMDSGELRDSELGPFVLQTLQRETTLELAEPYQQMWTTAGIRLADFYYTLIQPSAGERDWQRDFAKTATPILVGVAKSLERSADAQAVVVRLCEVVAQQLRLKVIWSDDPDELNEARNAIYRACLAAHEVESDNVLMVLQGLTVVGPA
ncbi:MAG: toll/interleukin-1 receptor domain-containing protein [Candidatus Anammoximicrobium sp.]|nr:toll/interleukin-1 receptor domain-containing protein [Candidatus Anammoximicrobium sp.]